jgi:hypothetical protein
MDSRSGGGELFPIKDTAANRDTLKLRARLGGQVQ